MDALLTAFVAAALAEFGDKTQLLVMALAARYAKPGPILMGVLLAALVNSALAAAGGVLLHGFITLRATSLLVAVALVFAGLTGFFRPERPAIGAHWVSGAFATTALGFFLLEFADKSQFITLALAAQYDSLALTALGAAAGIAAASVPAILLGNRLAAVLPLRPIRIALSALLLLAGFIVAINALRLI